MHPDRVARLLAVLGIYLLLAVLALRVVSLVNIAWQNRMGALDSSLQPVIPSLGRYSMSPDGREVTFEKQVETNGDTQWFRMPLVGGPATPTEPPETVMDPFLVRDYKLFLMAGDGYTQVQTSPRDTRVGDYARSPDGSALAFAAYRPGGIIWGLYILHNTGSVDWLGDHDRIGEIAWAPDNQRLAYIAVTKGAPQIFIARRDGQQQRQLTGDSTRKSRLRWSPDGRMVAYIETTGKPLFTTTPTPAAPPPHGPYQTEEPPPEIPRYAIAVIDVPAAEEKPSAASPGAPAAPDETQSTDAAKVRRFLQDEQEKRDMSWGMEDSGPVVVYTLPLPDHPKTVHLYALDPHSGKTRRAVPPQEITGLECPATIPGNDIGTLRISITNSSPRPADVHVLLRARPQRFPSASKLNTDVVRSESVPVPAGATQTVDWSVAAKAGLSTHISVLINPNTTFPMDEKRCTIRNTNSRRLDFLPNLPYLSMVPPVTLAGFLLCIPWLRKQKKWFLWVLYLALPVFIFAIIIIETILV